MRIYLVQPDDSLARTVIDDCRDVGYSVLRLTDPDPEVLSTLGDDRPDALVVCLDADATAALRLVDELVTRRRLRGTPLVFTGGTQAALDRAQDSYPRANFARADVLLNVLASLKS